VENRRFLARSGNTGVTMIVDPVGRVTRRLAMDREGILAGDIHAVGGTAFYTRQGDRPVIIASLAILVIGLLTGFVLSSASSRTER